MPTCGNGVSRTRPGEHRRRTNLRNCQDPLVLVSCGVWRVRRCVSAAVLLCLRARGFALTSCFLKLCHLSRKTQKRNRGDGEYRTRPGEHRRRTNLRNCQDPLVLVSCGVWRRCVCSVSSFFFCQSPFRSRSSKRERAMCVQHTERNRRSRR